MQPRSIFISIALVMFLFGCASDDDDDRADSGGRCAWLTEEGHQCIATCEETRDTCKADCAQVDPAVPGECDQRCEIDFDGCEGDCESRFRNTEPCDDTEARVR